MKNKYLIMQSFFKGAFSIVFLALFSNTIHAQDYTVAPIPYQIYTATSAVQGTLDDTFSSPITLGFDFDFYGVSYNQVNISTNGYISFAPQVAGTFAPWSFNQSIPNANFPAKNAFLGCYHDMDNGTAVGTLTYAIIGSAPYRKLVVLFNNQPHFSNNTVKSSFQMVLYETLNIMDVQLIDKQLVPTWNAGNAVTGIINEDGLEALAAPNRNTSAWTAFHEGWRFQRPINTSSYLFAKCDNDADGFVSFNLQVVQNDLLPTSPASVTFYSNETDAISQTNAYTNLNYTNVSVNTETIYANVNGEIKTVVLRVVDCENDYDLDSVATADEDLNADTNLANDDTDGDGIANFIDNDDDGDLILTSVEYVFNRSANGALAYLDTDNDGILNYLDNDDDGDNVLTINEDYNNNNNPADDDTNVNSIPDYLESAVALAVNNFDIKKYVSVYPNPVSTVLNIENKSNETISNIAIYSINGSLVKEIKSTEAMQTISVSDLQNGIYFVKIELNNQVINYKFSKK
jgi:hypothetical protein